ncbi:hypothetical protein GCM10008955_09430 [Deinococcus malanensis]|uniref:Tetratricopeptide repeat protein n=1 Tax=Deinococcus malanensis TaxID=1706855 RepID=A0ABQ2EN20_9DEIO|nr:hypothetical protein [Deinococcus malanensis]GGK18128.1 hypothetical protein GCM10008955_09430 [Deinococcus malanensis]
MGIFSGGFTATVAEALGVIRPELDALVRVNLVQRDGSGGRYELLETVRAVALEQLAGSGESEAVHLAHARYYREAREGYDWNEWAWMAAEVGNLRSALRWAMARQEPELALQLTLGMSWFWESRGDQREALSWYEQALALPGDLDPLLRLRGLYGAATPAWQMGLFGRVQALLQECLDLARDGGWPDWQGRALMALGRVALEQGHATRALDHLHPGLELVRQHGDAFDQVATLYHLADASLAEGHHDHARAYAEEALDLCCIHPGLFWHRLVQTLLGELALAQGQFAEARAYLAQANDQSGHWRSSSIVLAVQATCFAVPGADEQDLMHAARLWGAIEAHEDARAQRFSVPYQARLDRYVQSAQARLPKATWDRAWAEGREMGLQGAVVAARPPQVSHDHPEEQC